MSEVKNVTLPVYSQTGEKVSKITLKGEVFGIEPNKQAMFDDVQVYRANCRQATAKTKKRDEVSGGGIKPWRQKGTGRARAGSIRSPLWVGGGTVFGPTGVQNYKLSQNTKAHRLALRSALSIKAKEGLIVLDALVLEEIKTKEALKVLESLKVGKKVLVVINEEDENICLSTRNLPNVKVVLPNNVSVYDLLNVDSVVILKEAVKTLEGGLING